MPGRVRVEGAVGHRSGTIPGTYAQGRRPALGDEIPAIAGQHPTKVDKRKLRKVELHHLSWTQVLAEAVMQKALSSEPEEFRRIVEEQRRFLLEEKAGSEPLKVEGTSTVEIVKPAQDKD